MAVTENLYTGNGSSTNYSFTFPYLETTDIKVSINGTITTAYTLANPTTIQFTTAPANGAAIRIYRVTDDSALAATFYSGAAIRATDLNENFTQNLYVTQESNREATTAITTANSATSTANTALSTANAATVTANTASTNASAAVATANTANTNASAAVSTANTASSNATTAVNTANAATATANTASTNATTAISTANTALSTANTASTNATTAVNTANAASSAASSAVSTANTASTNASNAVTTANAATSTANTALSTANTAISTANAAASAVANAILYDIVANVAAIPASPANNDAVEVTNSTGIQSFTPLSGIPAGFVGDSGLSVRIVYTTTGSTWNWIQYFPNDPESRYINDAGDVMTGALGVVNGTAAAPGVYFDANTGIYSPGADQVAISTNGTGKLFINSSGVIEGYNTVSTGTGITTGLKLNSARATGGDGTEITWNLDFTGYSSLAGIAGAFSGGGNNGHLVFKTVGSGTYAERMRLDSSGRLGLGTSSPANLFQATQSISRSSPPAAGASGHEIALGSSGYGIVAGTTTGGSSYIASTRWDGTATNYNLLLQPNGGSVGIGTTSPQRPLDVNGSVRLSSGSVIEFGGTVTNFITGDNSNNYLAFGTNSSERARIDSSGRLLVGTSSSSYAGLLTVSGNTTSSTGHGILQLQRGSNATTAGNDLGAIWFGDGLGGNRATIEATADAAGGAGDLPSRLVFSTTADGASSPTERMRIAQNGVITIQNGAVAVIGTLTDAATITPDFAADCNFTVTLGGARTIANPTNLTAGQSGSIFLVQDGTGGRTAAWGSYWDFPGGTAPTLTTTANAVDRIDYIVRSSTSIHTVFTANYS